MKNKAEIKTSIAGLAVNLLLAISKILAGILWLEYHSGRWD